MFSQPEAKDKWNAWEKNKGLSQEHAKDHYACKVYTLMMEHKKQ
jgi:acyl-CoA-binding protein